MPRRPRPEPPPWRPAPEQIEPFLADLQAVYEKHQMHLSAGEPIIAQRSVHGHVDVRVRSRLANPEGFDLRDFDQDKYERVTEAAAEVDDIRLQNTGTSLYDRY